MSAFGSPHLLLLPESKAARQRTHSKTLRERTGPTEFRQVLECVRCRAALD